MRPASPHAEEPWRRGVQDSLPFTTASFVLSLSFGVVAVEAGFSALAALVMSAVVYGGAGQFAVVGILERAPERVRDDVRDEYVSIPGLSRTTVW